MTVLNCSATTCIYNENELCSRGEIEVLGSDARHSDETACGSFRDRNGMGVINSTSEHCGCEKILIDCQAEECTYNSNCKCTAAAIDIEGHNARDVQGTKCDTFACRC